MPPGDLLAFSADQVMRLTGLTPAQLRYWDDSGFFHPELVDERGGRYGRAYSFRDVVGLRTLAVLRNKHKVSLQQLREVGAFLAQEHDTPWASLRFYVGGKNVYFNDPKTGRHMAVRPAGQHVIAIEMEQVADDVQAEARRLRDRTPEQYGKIVQHRRLLHNAPVIEGTRIPTSAIYNLHEAGYSHAQIIDEYPRLTEQDVRQAIEFEERKRGTAGAG